MELIITEKTKIRDVVVKYPQTRAIFEKYGIDYCCGGADELEKAAQEKGISLSELSVKLNEAVAKPQPADDTLKDWSAASPSELADYIEKRHHGFMKAQLPRLRNLLLAVQRAHGERHGRMLRELEETYNSLQWEIERHLMKEERILFPYIRQIEAYAQGRGDEPEVHCGSIQNPIRQMEHEHENAGEALAKMRKLTADYSPPQDACATFRALYDGLQALEADLHQHIHLENNILFPKSVEMECASGIV